MALGLNRIWVRFGLWITAAVLLAIAALATGVLAFSALALADRGYVLETGRITLSGGGRELIDNEQVRAAYLGM